MYVRRDAYQYADQASPLVRSAFTLFFVPQGPTCACASGEYMYRYTEEDEYMYRFSRRVHVQVIVGEYSTRGSTPRPRIRSLY